MLSEFRCRTTPCFAPLAARPDIAHTATMLHMMKLAVGVRDLAHLRALQAARRAADPPLRHRTRNFPRRRDEIIDGGSMYWVIAGTMLVRQRIADIVEDRWDDDTQCAAIVLQARLTAVVPRPFRPFQGWRYLAAEAAPPDLAKSPRGKDADALPPALERELRALGLL
jgi:hypothetical protein